ncbi:ABC transporter substrate-binding protein [Rothia sp. ZJ1223]|nr:ABC transporter substrate-binding protein [Rothia sp. ZJ1223]MBM7050876.1 ABC transporter substrate-binding protein [Rothia sp. ZJ1223]
MKFMSPKFLALAATSALLATGCGASEEVPSSEASKPAASAAGDGKTSYPLTIENCGVETVIEKAPERVVSLDQNSTEILLSLGLADRMVGTASWTDPVLDSLASENEKVPRLADNAPSFEVLMDADPDFVTASFGRHFNTGGVVTRDRLAETEVSSYLSPTDCDQGQSINGGGTRTVALTEDVLFQEIREMAEIFDVQERGEELITDLEQRADAALEGADFDDTSVAFWFADTKTPYMAGGKGSAQMLAHEAGMTNVFESEVDDWPTVTWEAVIEKNPEVLVLGDLKRDRFPGDRLDDKIEFLKNDPLTQQIDAVKNENFIALHGAEMNPSIRYVDGLEKIGDWYENNQENVGK